MQPREILKIIFELAVFCFFLHRTAFAADILDIASPAFKVFTDENGLPSNSVMTIDRDRFGRLWIGTQDGAAYFNGHHWVAVNMPDRNISNYIYDILAGSDGSMWFASEGNGVHRLNNGRWTSYGPANGLASNFARVLLETADGAIWAGTRDGLFKFDGITWIKIETGNDPERARIRSLAAAIETDGSETVWVGTYGGLLRFAGSEMKIFDTGNGLPHNTVFALLNASEFDGGKRIFVGTDRGLVSVSGDSIDKVEGPEQLRKGIRSIATSKTLNGETILWIGTDGNGLLAFEDGKWSVYDRSRGLSGELVFGVLDAEIGDGSVWTSSLGHGIARLERGNWHTLTESHGLPKRVVFSVAEQDGNLWFATFGGGLAGLGSGKWKTVKSGTEIPSDFVYSLASVDLEGRRHLFAGTEDGVAIYDGGRWTRSTTAELRSETWAFHHGQDETGDILRIGTSRGLVEVKNGVTVRFTNSKNGLPDDRVRVLHEAIDSEAKRTLWVGTYGGGLARFENGSWTTVDVNSGLPSNRVLALTEFTVGGRRKLFVGTSGGIAMLDIDDPGSPLDTISSDNTPGMLNDYILDFVIDTRGRLYALTNRGVSRFTPSANGSGIFDVYTFTTDDGLPSNECVSGSGFLDSAGRLFVGTVEGVAVLDLNREVEDSYEKPLLIEAITVGGRTRPGFAGSILNYSDNNIRFNYALLSNFREQASRYRTHLVGFEDSPTEWTAEPYREFSYLPAGEYEFQVWARDQRGNVSTAASIPFTVRPAWWQTWWAMLLYLLTVVAIVSLIAYMIYRNRLNRLLEIEKVRARIATDLHDDIGASLSQIAILSEVMSQKLGPNSSVENTPLATIADTSRDLTTSMSDIVWAINPKRNHLLDLIQRMRRFATEVLSAKDIEFEFTTPDGEPGVRLDMDTRRQVYLIFKEAVNNCVRHSGCSYVAVHIQHTAGAMEMTVKDNGNGFKIGADHSGNGLTSMDQRAISIGGVLTIDSNGNGTTVHISLPLKQRRRIFGN